MRRRHIDLDKSLPHGTHLNLNFESKPLETFSSICCCFGVQKANEINIEDPKMLDIANTFLLYEEAMVKAQKLANELHSLRKKLSQIPDLNPKMSQSIDWMSKSQENMLEGSKSWSSMRNDVEEELLAKLLGKGNGEGQPL